MRIAQDPEHEDLSGKDIAKSFKQRRNIDRKVYVTINANGAKVTIGPTGEISIESKGELSTKAPSAVTTDTPEATFEGNVRVKNAATGMFTNYLGQTLMVQDGIVVAIS